MVHGDDADSHRRRSFLVMMVGSVLTGGNMFDSRLLCYVLDNSRAMASTVATLDTWIAWSLTELQLGSYLDIDPFGRPLEKYAKGRSGEICGGWKGIVVVFKGDERHMQKAFKLSHGAVSKKVCVLCEASSDPNSDMLYTYHGPMAPHRRSMLSTSAFIERVAGVQTWIRIPGFHIDFLQHDLLHVCDLTIIPECAASALYELVQEHVWGPGKAVDQRLRLGYVEFIQACKAARVRNRGVFFSMWLVCRGKGLCGFAMQSMFVFGWKMSQWNLQNSTRKQAKYPCTNQGNTYFLLETNHILHLRRNISMLQYLVSIKVLNAILKPKMMNLEFFVPDSQESVVLAKWLERICLEVAMNHPDNEHAQFLRLIK